MPLARGGTARPSNTFPTHRGVGHRDRPTMGVPSRAVPSPPGAGAVLTGGSRRAEAAARTARARIGGVSTASHHRSRPGAALSSSERARARREARPQVSGPR
ncbi:hypothetical protein GCM10010129_43870 [Streptomyces fumigatiscleroticus]|nr:hypothetical protein GCM10010129_43870 [Streptomyces fumigatiscleroticus]